jgi:sugar/nucleoside kinase (ribokinase family)
MKPFVSAIAPINIDILYSGLLRVPNLGEEVYSKQFETQLGGGPTATIIALARLGVHCEFGTFLSNDLMSIFASDVLKQNNVMFKNLYKGSNTPVIVTSIASFPEDRFFISYVPEWKEIDGSDEEIYQLFTGSKVCRGIDGHNEVLKKLKDEGTRITYDVAWSDNLNIESLRETLQYVEVFTPNEAEALKMTGKATVEEALEVISRYVEKPIIKIGKDGCITKVGNKFLHVPALDVFQAVDTTGAGDNFLAGIMYGMMQDWEIETCMKMGNIVGGYSTTELGCNKAHLTLDKAMEYMGLYE